MAASNIILLSIYAQAADTLQPRKRINIIMTVSNITKYICLECGLITTTKTGKYNLTKYICSECGYITKTKTGKYNHGLI